MPYKKYIFSFLLCSLITSITYAQNYSCKELLRATKSENTEKVRQIAKSVNPNCTYRGDGEPRTALNAAARGGNIEIGEILLAAGANVEYKASGDASALLAAARNGNLDFVKLLVENGAKVNRKMRGDGTALIAASENGYCDVVEYLISKKANVNSKVSGDGTALIVAVRGNHYDVAKMLLQNGCQPKPWCKK